MPAFTSDVLPSNLHAYAADALQRAVTADDVRQVFSDVREAETHPVECRCLVCGCAQPRNPHETDLPILQPDAPASVAPHTDEKQTQLALTICPQCGKSAQDVTDTGYWYTGMVCPVCGHEFTSADERTMMVDELRSLRAEVLRAIDGEVMRPFVPAATVPQETRAWAEHEIVRGAGGRIIGNIYDGVFHPAEGVSHEHVREALALHEAGGKTHAAIATYLKQRNESENQRRVLSEQLYTAIQHEVKARSEAAGARIDAPRRPGYGVPSSYRALWQKRVDAEKAYEDALAAAQPLKDDMAELLNREAQTHGVGLQIEAPEAFEHFLQIWPHLPSGADIAALLHARSGDTIKLGAMGRITLEGSHEAHGILRRRSDNGLVEFSAPTVRVDRGERSAASGREIVATIAHMQRMGIQVLTAQAERGMDWNGYYTWARMGFVGDIPASVLAMSQARFGENVTRVEQIMTLPGGPKWWKENGVTWYATFDFRDGSLSRQVFDRLAKSLEDSA